jgi:protease-4
MAEGMVVSDLVRNKRQALYNRCPLGRRLFRRRRLDYVVLRVSGDYPERTLLPRRRFPLSMLPWPPPPPSVETFTDTLERLSVDSRVRGIVLVISNLSAGPATLASLREAVIRFRDSGKRAIAYLYSLGMWPYYLATACEEILVPESATFRVAGLWAETIFLKNALDLVGIEANFEAIAEYKVSPDTYCRTKMTEPHREMLESLLDSLYDELTGAMAKGRNLAAERIQELLDTIPLSALQAHEAGLLDGVCYEDELPARLGTPETPATLVTWNQAQRHLRRPRRWRSRRLRFRAPSIGVISLEGVIVPGPSRRTPIPLPLPMPLPGSQAGSDTVIQQLRAAAQDKRLAAVVLHVDSPGGSAMASDLIWREVVNLRRTKPVVVYMSNQAASGGYYVSAPASAILAQATTLTGSIGVWGGKFVTQGLLENLRIGREVVSRGRAAGLYSDTTPFSEGERAKIRADIGASYARFRRHVAEGRGMDEHEVEAVARGRVWTGEQALAHGLVDELGDLQTAADKARQLAGISPRHYAPLVNIPPPRRHLLAQPSSESVAADWFRLAGWFAGLMELLREGVFALAPWMIHIRS